eukprot:225615_1
MPALIQNGQIVRASTVATSAPLRQTGQSGRISGFENLETFAPAASPEHSNEQNEYSKYSWRIGTISRIPIYLHYTLPLIWVIEMLMIPFQMLKWAPKGEGLQIFGWGTLIASCYCVGLFLSVLGHELGHAFVARSFEGGSVDSILLWPFGGLTFCGSGRTWKQQVLISLAGPAFNVLLTVGWLIPLILTATKDCSGIFFLSYCPIPSSIVRQLIHAQFLMNLTMSLFNLFVPVYPLDGSKIAACILTRKFSIKTSAIIMMFWASIAVAMLCAAMVMFETFRGGFFGFMILWVALQAYQMFTSYQANELHNHPVFRSAGQPLLS